MNAGSLAAEPLLALTHFTLLLLAVLTKEEEEGDTGALDIPGVLGSAMS